MKKIFTMVLVCGTLGLTACDPHRGADYGYETQAPYATERTVGAQTAPAERVFEQRMRK